MKWLLAILAAFSVAKPAIAWPGPRVRARRQYHWADLNPVGKLWSRDHNIFLLIAIVAIVADVLRVLPLTVSNLLTGSNPAGMALKVGGADFLLAAFLILAHPSLWSIVAIVTGFLAGVTLQATTGCPALSGWFAICLPWLIVNRREFTLSVGERYSLLIIPALAIGYTALVFTGHVVDPAMQGPTSIGYFYTTSDRTPNVGEAVQAKIAWHGIALPITRRLDSVEKGLAMLETDDLELGESRGEAMKTPLTNLRPIVWTWSPTRAMRSLTARGRFQNWVEFSYSPAEIRWDPDRKHVAVQDGNMVRVFPGGATVEGKFVSVTTMEMVYYNKDLCTQKWVMEFTSGLCHRMVVVSKAMSFNSRSDTLILAGDVTSEFPSGKKVRVGAETAVVTSATVRTEAKPAVVTSAMDRSIPGCFEPYGTVVVVDPPLKARVNPGTIVESLL